MSQQESNFLKWAAGIGSAVIIAVLISSFTVLSSVDVLAEKERTNRREILELREFHKDDVQLIREDIKEIKDDQKEIKQDIKKVLEKL